MPVSVLVAMLIPALLIPALVSALVSGISGAVPGVSASALGPAPPAIPVSSGAHPSKLTFRRTPTSPSTVPEGAVRLTPWPSEARNDGFCQDFSAAAKGGVGAASVMSPETR
jgi:hypothetical protein